MRGFTTPLVFLLLAWAGPAGAGGPAFRQPLPDLFTAGQPSAQQLHDAAQSGITTVIDLRMPQEDRGYDEAAAAEQLGLRYVRLPIGGADDLTEANARALDRILKQDGGRTLLHCASGNRAGALLALLRARLEGVAPDAALQLGRDAGLTSLEPAVRAALEASPTP
ncbi:beta-lactamase hydrolase domain-containing protein [Stenotrophomonas mori]|uniref:Tyrosine-protein phosphatase n=1 Tax=Stenotrophomonas mori TaxID=2871096 RepID=A0ABT0SJK6_9GAMM|nr:sulfur transferase domain-containing protein [Stenotrophomonas mori]MCL7715516.1 tyrosine-protein phosphatase [Stenotrophomonas mori]